MHPILSTGYLCCRLHNFAVVKQRSLDYRIYDLQNEIMLMRTFRKSTAIDKMVIYYEEAIRLEEASPPLAALFPPPIVVYAALDDTIELQCGDIMDQLDDAMTKAIKQMKKNIIASNEKSPVCCDLCECDDIEFLNEYETEDDGATVLCAICAYETKAADPKEITFGGGAILS